MPHEFDPELLLEVVMRALPFSIRLRGGARSDARVLPRLAASYIDREMKLVRQLSLEVHAAASRDSDVRKLLPEYDEAAIGALSAIIATAQRERSIDAKVDPEYTARAISTFIMGLNHMDTLNSRLVGNRAWREYVANRVALLMGITR